MKIPNESMDSLILAIQESDDQTLITVWKSVSSGSGFVKMDPKLLKAFYDEFERRPGLLASISESQNLNSRLVELAGIVHRSTAEPLNESTRERNKLARRHMKYGQDSFELSQLRQRFSKEEVIDQWDLFWNEETNTWFHSYYDRNGKRDAYDTRVGDKSDPHRAALAADGVSNEADFLRASGQMGAMMESRLLLEEEEEDKGDEEGGGDLFGDEGGDEGEGEEEEEAEEKEEEKDSADEPEEVPEKLSAKEVSELGPGEFDLEIDTVLSDIFDKSQKAFDAALQTESIHRKSMSSLLFENSDYEKFDMDRFAREVARYINNYTTLMDVEGMLFNKAKKTLLSQFGDLGKTAVSDFEEHMARVHGIDFTDKFKDDIIQQPVAVGSGSTGA